MPWMPQREKGAAKPFSLNKVLFSTFLFAFLVPSALLIFLLFSSFLNKMTSARRLEETNTVNLLSAQLSESISTDLEMSLTYFFDDDLSSFYNFLNRTPMQDDLIGYNQRLQPYSTKLNSYMTLLNKNIIGVGFIPARANVDQYFYIPRYHSISITECAQYRQTDWYRRLETNNSAIIFTREWNPDSAESISLIRAAKNVNNKQLLGYTVVDISLDFLYDRVNALSVGARSGILLCSPTGELLLASNTALGGAAPLLAAGTESLSWQGDRYTVTACTDSRCGFTFYYLSSQRDLYSSYWPDFALVLVFYCSLTALAYFIFRYTSGRISRSAAAILSAMAGYQAGTPGVRCEESQCPVAEFRLISQNLNTMFQKINEHINTEYRLQMEQKIAEFQALQAEVDPHFLYNTLSLFVTLNRLGERRQLEDAIISLSQLFRYTCEHASVTTIRQEFDFLKSYLSLQKIRYDDRLDYRLTLPPELSEQALPKLIVQPLVENAIVHALEPCSDPVQIDIFAGSTANAAGKRYYYVGVVNNGLPYTPRTGGDSRVGLNNVRTRLRIFNADATLTISGGVGKSTRCFLIFPL